MSRVEVAPARDLAPGDRRIVETPRGEVGVFNVDGSYHALLNTCAHQSGPVCTGKIYPKTTGTHEALGRRVREEYTDEQVVKCPWHGWEYEIATGDLVGGGRSLPTFDVVVEDGVVYVEV